MPFLDCTFYLHVPSYYTILAISPLSASDLFCFLKWDLCYQTNLDRKIHISTKNQTLYREQSQMKMGRAGEESMQNREISSTCMETGSCATCVYTTCTQMQNNTKKALHPSVCVQERELLLLADLGFGFMLTIQHRGGKHTHTPPSLLSLGA